MQNFAKSNGNVNNSMKNKMVEGHFEDLIQEVINQHRGQFGNSTKTDYGKKNIEINFNKLNCLIQLLALKKHNGLGLI